MVLGVVQCLIISFSAGVCRSVVIRVGSFCVIQQGNSCPEHAMEVTNGMRNLGFRVEYEWHHPCAAFLHLNSKKFANHTIDPLLLFKCLVAFIGARNHT